MNPSVKHFIEHSYTLLDENMSKFFLAMFDASTDLGVIECEDICNILSEAGIDFEDARQYALHEILIESLNELANDSDGIFALPVPDFIQAFLDNRLGYSINFVQKYMFDNASKFWNLADIYYDENNIPIVSKR